VNYPPVANAGGNQFLSESEVIFNGFNSKDNDGEIIRYTWEFGDGLSTDGVHVKHVYTNPGTYNVKLTVQDDSETSSDKMVDNVQIIINDFPIADAGPDINGIIGEELSFDGVHSVDPDGKILEFQWDFGDGLEAKGEKVKHAYSHPGVYIVRLQVKDNSNHDQARDFDYVKVVINAPPVAIIKEVKRVSPNEKVVLDGSGSYDTDGNIAAYKWDFDDGITGSGAKPDHLYKEPGIYTVTLTVSDDSGLPNGQSVTETMIHVNGSPQAVPGKDIESCSRIITFDGSLSSDPDGDRMNYYWDFNDGSPVEQSAVVTHTFPQGGAYPVTLTVSDNSETSNSQDKSSITVRINQTPTYIELFLHHYPLN